MRKAAALTPSPAPLSDAGSVQTQCTPTILATSPSRTFDIDAPSAERPLVIGGFLYWVGVMPQVDPSASFVATIYRVATSGGPSEQLATFGVPALNAGSESWGTRIAFDDAHMYWLSNGLDDLQHGALRRANLDGSNAVALLSDLHLASGLAYDAGTLFFVVNGELHRYDIAAATLTPITGPFAMLFADQGTEFSAEYMYRVDGPLLARMPYVKGVEPADFVGPPGWQSSTQYQGPGLGGLSLDATDAYAISATRADNEPIGPGSVVRLPFAGGTESVIAEGFTSGPAWAARTAIDASDVYFNSVDAIMRVPLSGGTPQTIGPTQRTGGIALDDTRVYWTSLDDQHELTVWSACK